MKKLYLLLLLAIVVAVALLFCLRPKQPASREVVEITTETGPTQVARAPISHQTASEPEKPIIPANVPTLESADEKQDAEFQTATKEKNIPIRFYGRILDQRF